VTCVTCGGQTATVAEHYWCRMRRQGARRPYQNRNGAELGGRNPGLETRRGEGGLDGYVRELFSRANPD